MPSADLAKLSNARNYFYLLKVELKADSGETRGVLLNCARKGKRHLIEESIGHHMDQGAHAMDSSAGLYFLKQFNEGCKLCFDCFYFLLEHISDLTDFSETWPCECSRICSQISAFESNEIEIQIMLERDTGRPRGFGFITFADRRGMEDAIREMHGRELGDRAISVNKAQPKMGGDDPDHGYGYPSGGRGSYGGARPAGQDDCFKCGRPGHWARDCPSGGGPRAARPFSPPRSRFGGAGGRGDRDRYVDVRYDRGRYEEKDRFDAREDRYGGRGVSDRYPPPVADRYAVGDRYDRYGGPDRYAPSSFGKDRGYDRDAGLRGSSDRFAAGGPVRFEGRSYRERPAPYDRPRHAPSFDRY
ncbi:hypothetical protein LIER_24888 [Lithospermum erythrorhizon]|uniref:Glycine-rich RNA-binding protein RZ1C n=1 Tax=Lithospermum erythrorhizon TaxID=34254 RepID=A0AAV3R2S8_LITER